MFCSRSSIGVDHHAVLGGSIVRLSPLSKLLERLNVAIHTLQLLRKTLENGRSETITPMFRCPFLLPAQRIYFAYRYYMWQVQQQPHMRKFLADRFAARQQGRLAQARQGGATARGLPPITQAAQAQAGRRNNFSQRPRSNWGSGNAGSKAPGERPWLPPNSPSAARTPRFAPQDAHRYTVAILQRVIH